MTHFWTRLIVLGLWGFTALAALIFAGCGMYKTARTFYYPARWISKPLKPKEDHSMRPHRLALVAILGIALILASGCSTLFPTVGNGQLDMPVEIEVVYVDDAGIEYHAEAGPTNATFYVTAAGGVYEPVSWSAADGIAVTGPDGSKIRIKRVAQAPDADPPPAVDADGDAMDIITHMEALP